MDTDTYNVIKNILKETFPNGTDFSASSEAFKGVKTTSIMVTINDGAVSIYVPSGKDDYAPYCVGQYDKTGTLKTN